METQDWDKIEEMLNGALELEPSARKNYVDNIDSIGLRGEVESLLALDSQSDDFLKSPAVALSSDFFETDDSENADALAGQKIGNYRIAREIGRGGMGAVYLATRSDGKFEQTVALKMLKRELNTAAVRRRFGQEQQILSKLEHANIARLLDTGTTDDGVPFLVMEYAAGVPVTEFCERENLDLTERLKLFRAVCAAVSFAHQNLIVHRDLKPSNILVTDDGAPKLLDFGIAKLLVIDDANSNARTITNLGAMTPEYASPEQIRGESVTTATDVYSLGVILYELLTAHRPFELKTKSAKEILRAVCETEPTRPSEVESRIEPRATDFELQKVTVKNAKPIQSFSRPSTLNSRLLRGDLDNIVLKALKKDASRRYSSVEQFSEDIGRHLAGLPVSARPDTLGYRAEKFITRHKFGVAAALLILLTLLGGVSATVWQARRAERQEQIAQQRFNEARKIANSFLFEIYPQIENLEGATAAKVTLVKRALEYLDNLARQSEDDAALRRELAAAYQKVGDVQGMPNQPNLGDLKGALESYRKAQALRETLAANEAGNADLRDELATNYEQQGFLLWWLSDTKQTVSLYEKSLPLRRDLIAENPQSVRYRKNLAGLQMYWGDVPSWNNNAPEALKHYAEARAILENLIDENPNDAELNRALARCLVRVGASLKDLPDFGGALEVFEKAEAIYAPLAAANPNDYEVGRGLWRVRYGQCEVFLIESDNGKASETCAQLKNLAEKLNIKDKDALTQHDLASSYAYAGEAFLLARETQKATGEFNKSLALDEKLAAGAPDDDEYKRAVALARIDLGKADFQAGNFDAAFENQQKAQAILEQLADGDAGNSVPRFDLATVFEQFGEIYEKRKSPAQAQAMFSRALEILRQLDAENSLTANDKKILVKLEAKIKRVE